MLHMIRMMMYDKKTGDQQFKEMMPDFVNAYRGKAALRKTLRRPSKNT